MLFFNDTIYYYQDNSMISLNFLYPHLCLGTPRPPVETSVSVSIRGQTRETVQVK